jgi:hypothetical protein
MKKTIFLFAFLFVSLFASANEIESNNEVSGKNDVVETKVITVSDEDELSDLLLIYCITRTNYWYVGTVRLMDGNLYDQYDVEVTTTCY